jgi:sugar lactone lactonase YvrE
MHIRCGFWKLFVVFLVVVSVSLLYQTASANGIKVVDPKYKVVVLAKDTAMAGPNGANIGPDGNLYVSHVSNTSISRIDLKTMKRSYFMNPDSGLFIPDDLTYDGKGQFFVSGLTAISGQIYRIDKNGLKSVIATGFPGANGIQFNKKTGRLFVSECFFGNRVLEFDPTGANPPKVLVAKDVLNTPEGFDFDPDTQDLIIPDLGTGKIVRVNPDSGDVQVIYEKLPHPVALKIGPDKMAYIADMHTGEVFRLSLDGKKVETLAKLSPGLDNLAITKDGRLFVTSWWEATVYEVSTDGSGKYKALFPAGVNQIHGLAIKGKDVVVGDNIMLRFMENGRYVQTKINAWGTVPGIPSPRGLANGPGSQYIWSNWFGGALGIGDPRTGEFRVLTKGLSYPASMQMDKSESKLYVAEFGADQITEVSLPSGDKKVLAKDFSGPVSLALIGETIYVGETKSGRIISLNPATGEKDVFLAGGVGRPGALGNDGAGNLIVLDGGGKRLLRVSTKSGAITTIAENLPVRYSVIGSYPYMELPWPMAVNERGDIYFTTMERGIILLKKK